MERSKILFGWIDVVVYLFPSEAWGRRKGGIPDGYRANLVWGSTRDLAALFNEEEKCFYYGNSEGKDEDVIYPDGVFFLGQKEEKLGKIFYCRLRMAWTKKYAEYVSKNQTFLIREGPKVVGVGLALSEVLVNTSFYDEG